VWLGVFCGALTSRSRPLLIHVPYFLYSRGLLRRLVRPDSQQARKAKRDAAFLEFILRNGVHGADREIGPGNFNDYGRLEPHVHFDVRLDQAVLVRDDVRLQHLGKSPEQRVGDTRANLCQRIVFVRLWVERRGQNRAVAAGARTLAVQCADDREIERVGEFFFVLFLELDPSTSRGGRLDADWPLLL
jgi:hypothetical protein